MLETVIEVVLYVAGAYVAAGLAFSVVVHRRGLADIDPAVRDATWGFRLLITPGIVALWPLLWRRWKAGPGHPWLGSPDRPVTARDLRRRHGYLVAAVLIMVLSIAVPALLLRPADPVQAGNLDRIMRSGQGE
jgi:hypothetical protein